MITDLRNFALNPICVGSVYQTVWSPSIGEENLACRHEGKNEDEFAIGVWNDFQKETLVGHVM